MRNFFRILGISRISTPEEIKAAFRKRARATHPDRGLSGDADAFREVSEANETLSDADKRIEYEAEYHEYAHRLGCVVCLHCFSLVRVRRFKRSEKPRCGECKTALDLTPEERDARYRDALSIHVTELVEVIGVEGGELAKDGIRAASDGIRRWLGVSRRS